MTDDWALSVPSEITTLVLLQITLGAGTVCVFHVGGFMETSSQESAGVPRWEFFIGDRPHAPQRDKGSRRQPIEQIGTAETYANPGDVILSPEVVGLVGDACQTASLESGNGRLIKLYDAPADQVHASSCPYVAGSSIAARWCP